MSSDMRSVPDLKVDKILGTRLYVDHDSSLCGKETSAGGDYR